jgi:hypothetical protein
MVLRIRTLSGLLLLPSDRAASSAVRGTAKLYRWRISEEEGGPELPSRLCETRTALDLETRLAFAEEPVNRSVFR